jgi:hypothetical protein
VFQRFKDGMLVSRILAVAAQFPFMHVSWRMSNKSWKRSGSLGGKATIVDRLCTLGIAETFFWL